MAEEVAVSSCEPTVTVTADPCTLPVSPVIWKPAALSAMLTVLSAAMVARFRGSWPIGFTVSRKSAWPWS